MGQELPQRVVHRPGLERRLDDVAPGGLGLLVASAGSGKSVLVRQWYTSRAHLRVAVLTLSRRHEDPVVLARDLLLALRAVAPEMDPALDELVTRGSSTLDDTFVERLREGLVNLSDAVVLVVEDAHVLSNHDVTQRLGRLLTSLPRTTRAVVTTRRDLSWSLHRLRLDDRIVELRGADLVFREAEARALLESVSQREVPDELVAKLVQRTDGWAAGLQLAAISLRTAPDMVAFVDSFAGSDHLVAEYLLNEVIERQEPDVRGFLLETSVLDWLSPGLCDAVTGMGNASAMLDELYRQSMFLVPLDASSTTFRYHHLFAEVLRLRLRVEDPDAVDTLRHRAARWLLQHGHQEEAVEHLIDAGDAAAAFDLIASIGHRLFERGEATTLVRWLTAITREDPSVPPAVEMNLLAAQLAADDGPAATETYRRIDRRTDITRGDRAAANALYSMLVTRGLPPERALAVTDDVRDAVPDLAADEVVDFLGLGGRDSIEVMSEYCAGLARFFLGDLTAAATTLEAVLALPGMKYPLWKVFALGSLALVRAWQGRDTEAAGLARSALREAETFGATHHHACTHAHQALALVHLDHVDLDAADECLAQAGLDMRGRHSSTTYADVQTALATRAAAGREGPVRALELLRAPAASGTEPVVLAEARLLHRVSLLVGTGDLVGARALLHTPGRGPRDASAHVDLALAGGEVAAARTALDGWHPAPDDLRALVRRRLRQFTVLDAEGDHRAARRALTEAVGAASGDRLRWPFLEVPSALRAVRHGDVKASWLAGDALWDVAVRLRPRLRASDALPDPLTAREQAVLGYLPGRMRNQEIAADLFVSVNTVKTHVASIYRKLGVTDRDEAVSRAEQLGLL